MAAQSPKKLWDTCPKCDVQALVEDFPLHSRTSCPPPQQNWTHGFISQSILHGWLAETDDYEDQIEKYLHRIYLSAEVLYQCKISIGDPVIVTVSNISCVKRAWISSTKSSKLTTIFMPRRVLKLIWDNTKGDATVQKLNAYPLPTEKIIVSLKSENEELQSSSQASILTYLHKFYSGQIIFVGQEIILPYFGKDLLIKVENVVPISSKTVNDSDNSGGQDFSASSREEKLAEALGRLTIGSQGEKGTFNETNFYRVVASTQWTISKLDRKQSTSSMDTLGGLSDASKRLGELCFKALNKQKRGPPAIRGILLYGPPGTGKSLLVHTLAKKTKADFYKLKYDELYSKILGETEARLRSFFARVKCSSSAIVFLDRIHSLCSKRSSTSEATDLERRILNIVNTSLDELGQCDGNIVVLASTYDPDSLAPSIKRIGRLEIEVEIPVPGPDARFEILTNLLKGVPHKLSVEDVRSVSQSAHGFVGADLVSLASSARVLMLEMGQKVLTPDHVVQARKKIYPSAMKEVLVNIPNVRYSDIGGQEDLKLKLRQVAEWPMTHPESFARLGIRQPRGILMFGPPGCSKTMIAKALASESKLNFISIKGPELFNKYLGESERAVRSIFRRARQVAPAVIFFDEIDALGGERTADSGSNSNVEDRVLSQLLVEMNGIELLENVFIVAATNRPDLLDKALLRPGRLDHKVYVPLPDAETRRQIIRIQLKKMPVESVDENALVEATAGYSGAEIVAVCHEAALIAMSSNMDCSSVGPEHFMAALSVVLPRTSPALLQIFEKFL